MADIGILNAVGKSVSLPIPMSWLGRADAPMHRGTFGTFTDVQINNMMAQLAYSCSQWNTKSFDLTKYVLGKYSVTSAQLAQYGYLNSNFVQSHGPSSFTYSIAWTGQDGLADAAQFLLSSTTQDTLAYWLMQTNYNNLLALGGITADDSASVIAGMLFVAHLLGSADLAKQWRQVGSTNNQTYDFYNAGRYAIEVVSQQ